MKKMEWRWLMMRNDLSLALVVLGMLAMFQYSKGCLEEERAALLQFQAFVRQNPNSTKAASAALSSWVVGGEGESSCCHWERVECNLTTRRVIRLSLDFLRDDVLKKMLNWNLNATMFLPFQELQHLNLSHNDITGWLGNEGLERLSILTKLEVLDLTDNRFNSSIQLASLNAFPSLKKLYLGDNYLMTDSSGPNFLSQQGLDTFPRLEKLEVLDLSSNYLDNTILPSLGELTSLKELYLDFNELSGSSLPSDNLEIFCRLKKLQELDLSINHLDNSVLPSLGSLTSLKKLNLAWNLLNGTLPSGFLRLSRWNKLEILDLSYNDFVTTDILPSLATFTSLKVLSLRGTGWRKLLIHPQDNLEVFCRLNKLQVLDLSSSHLNNRILPCLSSLTSLKKLYLSSTQLNGTLPSGLCNLTNLQELHLNGNNFHGILPACLSNLTSLRVLDLSRNQFTGNISSSSPITTLTSLEAISLAYNNFEATIFPLISLGNHSKLLEVHLDGFHNSNHLLEVKTDHHEYPHHKWLHKSQLKVLTMSHCNFNKHMTDVILQLLNGQYNLEELYPSHAGLQGNFPTWLMENNTNLKVLELRNNSLKGPFILPSHSNMSLISLDVSSNRIQGTLQENIGEILPNLTHLNLSRNEFRDTIPSSVGAMKKLEVLDLSSNNFSGELPESLAIGCVSLMILKLSNNGLHGPIFYGDSFNLEWLESLHLANNSFTGNIPIGVSKCLLLQALNVGKNNISGMIPAWMGNLTYLEILVLRENSFDGLIPHEFCSLVKLTYLDLSKNHDLSGSIPSCLTLRVLKYLHLEGNRFTGLIQNIGLLQSSKSSLVTLNLGDNNFSGNIPSWIGGLVNLKVLILKGNHLHGSIPYQLCQLNQIGILDLSHNNLLGSIPSCLRSITFGSIPSHDFDLQLVLGIGVPSSVNIQLAGESSLTFGGIFMEPVEVELTTKSRPNSYEGSMLNIMSAIDLSCNKLTGEIPHEIGELLELRGLNLSYNRLNGKIPNALSNMRQLESLDLSHNKLSGEIPSNLNELNFLEAFSVAYNDLSGRTPVGGQFGTFNESSYKGNPLLCGAPPLVLEKNCSSSAEENPTMRSSSPTKWGYKYGIDTESFLVSFFVSYVMCLLSFFVVLYINPHWRRRWFHFIEARDIDSCLCFFINLYYKVFIHPFM